MGLRRLCFLLSVTSVLWLVGCGDNLHPVRDDAGDDGGGSGHDGAIDAPPDALMCTTPQIKCGDMCVNPATDNNHCGDCNTVCGNGSSCQTDGSSTKCCPTGQHNCGGVCVDESTDKNHCGSCNACPGANDTCQNGTCCGTGTTECTTSGGPQCFDLNTDENHCGTCSTMCSGSETCTVPNVGTTPAKCCATGDNNCSNVCSDPKTDNSNCGTCGNACTGTGNSCSDGKCCVAPTVSCNGTTCVNPQSDANCGATAGQCGTNCSTTGKVCKTNTAQTSEICCSAGQNNCGGACSDPLTDNNNCGACGTVCGNGTSCSNGVCCGPGESGCGSGGSAVCVDLNTDDGHCGSCNTACTGSTPVCDGAQCAAACDTTTSPAPVNCSGDCVFTGTDHDHCGNCNTKCAANQVCNGGVCQSSACPGTTTTCGGSCVDTNTDPNHCGNCATICNPGDECVAGVCQLNCGPGEVLCGGVCVNPLNNHDHCSPNGTCGAACGANQTCDDGVCCTAPTVNCSGGTTAAACVDPSSNTSCGATTTACGQNCSSTGLTCMTSGTTHVCCATGQTNCNGVCVDVKTDEANCGACAGSGGAVCDVPTGETCDNGLCCSSTQSNKGGVCCDNASNIIACNLQCVNKLTDKNNCGSCGNICPGAQICNNGSCATQCNSPNNTDCQDNGVPVCTNPQIDPFHCGDPACAWCTSGTCTSGVCQTCQAKDASNPDQCGTGPGSLCTNLTNDEQNCGTCGTMCQGFETCVHDSGVTTPGAPGYGTCCTTGKSTCGGACVDKQVGVTQPDGTTKYCGSCGNTCGAGSTCTNGACVCPFGTTTCGNGTCKTTVNDPNNCGGCGSDGAQFVCGNTQVCVSGECQTTCPAPLIKCGQYCINPDDDNANCGGCNKPCDTAGNLGCSAGLCVPALGPYVPTNPAKCIGGGPPIIVPTLPGGGGNQCTGNLGQVSFQFGMCSRTNLGPLSQLLTTDAFDSSIGAYHTCTANNSAQCSKLHCKISKATCSGTAGTQGTCAANDICDFPVKCVAGQCVGGGVGVNGWVTPVASDTAATTVGGDFWVFGLNGVSHAIATGLAMKGDTVVKTQFINHGSLDVGKTSHVYGAAFVTGAWTSGGNADMTIDGPLTTTSSCPPLSAGTLHLNGTCTTKAYPDALYPFTTLNPPCGRNDNTDGSLIDIQGIVTWFSSSAHNDNMNTTPNIPYNLLDGSSATTRLDLPCGYYYFNMLNIGKDTTIVVHGRTAIFIGGAMRVSQKLILDLDPGATLDIFVGAAVNVSNIVELGSPAFPRRSRLWIGGTGCLGSGTCSTNSTCCSGVCSNGACTAGGGNLGQAMSLSNGGNFNGLIWAGYGTFTHSNPLEMYGSIYTNYFDASGDTTVHYDKGATGVGEECPPPPAAAACESCRQCGNQPCLPDPNDNNKKKCGFHCTQNADCCAPLQCVNPGATTGICL